MAMKLAFVGFRHGHINSLHAAARKRDDVRIVACCEEDEATRRKLEGGDVRITHDRCAKLLTEVECDAVAVGDYYARRGGIAIAALESGRHVILDKPICTRLDELDRIEQVAGRSGLRVGCMLDMRDTGTFRTLRRLVRAGEIGEVHAACFGGQHPLMYGSRAGWYFEEGKHGGTINDIAIHGVDIVRWITGLEYQAVNAARNWNGRAKETPHFRDCAQVMLTMRNGCGVIGDVSYLAPDSFGYSLPQYWRVTLWGSDGVLEAGCVQKSPVLYRAGSKEPQQIEPDAGTPGGYLQAFLDETGGAPSSDGALTTADVLRASRVTLLAQDAADQGLTNVACG